MHLKGILEDKKEIAELKKIHKLERNKFLIPLTNSLMQLSGIVSPQQIPSPLPLDSPLRKKLFDEFQNVLIPMVVEKIFEELMEPSSRVKMALKGLESLNEALDKMPVPDKINTKIDDKAQRKLNKSSGELVLQLVQLVPKSMIKAAFKIERIQELTAEMVGKALREYLGENLDIMKLLNQGIEGGLDTLHPGTWVEENGETRFISNDGKLDFNLATNQIEEELKAQESLIKADREILLLRKEMVAITRRVMGESFSSFFTVPLMKLKMIWDDCVDTVFGKYGPHVHKLFELTGFKVVYRTLEVLSSILSFPMRAVFWFFMEIHIGLKVDKVIKSLEMDIHENLFYQIADTVIATFEKKIPAIPLEPILARASKRDEQEKYEVQELILRFGLAAKKVAEAIINNATNPSFLPESLIGKEPSSPNT